MLLLHGSYSSFNHFSIPCHLHVPCNSMSRLRSMAHSHRKSLSVPSANGPVPVADLFFCFSFCATKLNPSGLCPESCMPECPKVCQHLIPPTPSEHHHHFLGFQSLYPVFIVITVLTAVFFLAYCFIIYFKFFRRSNPVTDELGDAARHRDQEEEFVDENRNHGPVLDHPIWYINTIGLQPSVIASIAVCRYRKEDDGLIGLKDCTICLSEFEEGDIIRLLPKCSHAFHVSCIDTWLRSHTNCPMCRAGIVPELVTRSDAIHVPMNNDENSIEEVRIAVNSADGRGEEVGGGARDDKVAGADHGGETTRGRS